MKGCHELVQIQPDRRLHPCGLKQAARATVHIIAAPQQQKIRLRKGGQRHSRNLRRQMASGQHVRTPELRLGKACIDRKIRRNSQ